MKRLKWSIEFLIVVLFTLPIAVLPHRVALRAGEFLGSLLYFSWTGRRTIAIKNLRDAVARNALSIGLSSPEDVIKQNFKNLGKSFAEIVKIYYGLGDHIIRHVEIRGAENFNNALARGKGVIMISGHCGNWEILGLPLAVSLARISVVVRQVNNPYFDRMIIRMREKFGNSMIYKKGALRKILQALKKNEVVGILMDQSVVSSEGIKADFLGRKDYIVKTPALIARKTGAAVLPTFISRTANGHRIDIGEVIELDASEDADEAVINDTIRFSASIENYIRQNPSEWLWIHRRWKRSEE
jgi:KDO2-lipid IV(A) lauroyltransferase